MRRIESQGLSELVSIARIFRTIQTIQPFRVISKLHYVVLWLQQTYEGLFRVGHNPFASKKCILYQRSTDLGPAPVRSYWQTDSQSTPPVSAHEYRLQPKPESRSSAWHASLEAHNSAFNPAEGDAFLFEAQIGGVKVASKFVVENSFSFIESD